MDHKTKILNVLESIAIIIEKTYEHDEKGRRLDLASSTDAADIISELLEIEDEVWTALEIAGSHFHFEKQFEKVKNEE